MSKSVFVLLLGDGRQHGGLGGVEGAGPAAVHLPVHLQRLGDGGHGDLLGHLVNHLLGVALDMDIGLSDDACQSHYALLDTLTESGAYGKKTQISFCSEAKKNRNGDKIPEDCAKLCFALLSVKNCPSQSVISPRWGCCTGRSRWAACRRW